ncbi:unnamed protein product [Boreogadus saida]
MNPVNATALYVSASRSVLQCDPRDPRALAELCKLLPFFRQSLSCLVCGNLLQDPIAPTDSSCQHYVCRGCKGRRMQLKPSCSWCKDYSRFRENRQLSLLVHCYRKLCLYIAQSPLAPHIATAAGDSPDLRAILDEGLTLAEGQRPDDEEEAVAAAAAADGGAAGQSQDASAPEAGRAGVEEQAEEEESAAAAGLSVGAPEEGGGEESSSAGVNVNGLHRCNGLGGEEEEEEEEEEAAAVEEGLQCVAMETGGGGVLKQEAFGDELPMCVSLTASGEAGLCDITAFGEDLKHGGGGGSLLLSVEEVLRTLDTDPAPSPAPVPLAVPSSTPPDPAPPRPGRSSPSVPRPSFNGPHCPAGPDSSRLTPSLPPEDGPRHQGPPLPAAPRAPPRCHRKRSRSESDSEKLQPLPISSLLRSPLLAPSGPPHQPGPGAPPTTASASAAAPPTAKREPKFPHASPHQPLPHLAPVPNGGPPKVGKTVLVSSKGLKKTVEHHGGPKKAYSKARQGAPKPRPQPRDRLPGPHPHAHPVAHPPSPSKPLYKKPVEKKGCKCGRATQNPSVLTCRGQRCPCYSNRKACLDCICRGCQNSYMANGEKKLEAFAVPEKALEQTRLTLGINLTSITAAALRSPASSAPGNTLINVTTATGTPVTAAFLSGAGHDNRVFDDSLEMRFDC